MNISKEGVSRRAVAQKGVTLASSWVVTSVRVFREPSSLISLSLHRLSRYKKNGQCELQLLALLLRLRDLAVGPLSVYKYLLSCSSI